MFDRHTHELRPRADVCLSEKMLKPRLHGTFRHPEPYGDLLVRQSVEHAAQDVLLVLRQRTLSSPPRQVGWQADVP
jgi:hypothetical protein